MIYYIAFFIVSYSFVEQIQSVSSENEVFGTDVDVAAQTEGEAAVPTAGTVNFSGRMKASGKVTIVGSTEPAFDYPWGMPPMSIGGLHPEDDEVLILYDYPGSHYPTLDHGIPPFYVPPFDPMHMVPTFAPIPYGGPMFEPAMTPMAQPHFIEIFEPVMSAQPQFIEILDPTIDPMFALPQFIEIIEPHFGNQLMFDPFYSGFDVPYGAFNPSYPFIPQANVEMIPVLVEFDLSDAMFGQMSEAPGYAVNEADNVNSKRATQSVPMSGKVTIVGKF